MRGFLRKPFAMRPPEDTTGLWIKTASSWVLDFLRNLFVVSLLVVAARKSGAWYVSVLALIGWASLCAWCSWPLSRLRPNVEGQKPVMQMAITLVGVILVVSLLVGVVPTAIASAIDEIARARN
jgi:hypothetical protein